ncbi:MAG: DUF1778 domain-containing protein [Burkholderiales bacterium]|nr:DUF1778 domain-containing protein [Burkholderiales bacterium]
MANQDTPDTTRDARLEARVSAAQKRLLRQAAALSGRTLSEFVVAGAQDAARRVLAEHASVRLSREEQRVFVQALLNPPEPNARRKRAAEAYRRRTGAKPKTSGSASARILAKSKVEKEVVRETQAAELSERLAVEVQTHEKALGAD